MDPLSITTSAITLIQAAGSITSSLCGFITQCRGAEARITSLCDELDSLTSGLEAIDCTLKGRNALDLALVEDYLWKQCELALDDCHVTLNSLGVLVHKIKETVRAKAWAWRVRAVVNLNVYGGDLAAFRDKVHKSNWALQTMLQTINVSLSLRNNASQEAILFELDRLKSSIDEALRVSIRPIGGFSHRLADHSDVRVARNLRNLAHAAKHFHGAASSTASTVRDGSRGGAYWQAYPGAEINVSLMGDLPSFRRERVEEFVREGRHHRRSLSSGLTSPSFSPNGEHASRLRRGSCSPRRPVSMHSPRQPSFSRTLEIVTVPESVTVATADDDEEDDAEFERLFLDGLEELAKDRIKERDFDKAVEFLQEAMKREVGSKSDNEGFRNLQVQLALCYLLQSRWEMAEPIITGLAKNKAATDAVVCNLLHAMALIHLSLYLFDKALTVCREALLAKKKLLKRDKIDAEDYAQTQGLLVMIYELKGDWMHAEVYQSQTPISFKYTHPKNEVEFISAHPTLLATVLGDNLPDFSTPLPKSTPGLHELDGSGPDVRPTTLPVPALRRNHTYNGASPLKLKFTQHLMYENDTSKIVYTPETESSTVDTDPRPSSDPSASGDADDEASPTTSSGPESPVRRRLYRMFSARRAQPLRPAEVSAPPVESADVSACAPTKHALKSGWVNAMLGFKKSRYILRKTSHDPESPDNTLGDPGKLQKFRLLYMERMTQENAEQVNDPTYRRQYWSPGSFEHADARALEMDAGSDFGSGLGPKRCLMALPEYYVEDGSFAFKNGVPYIDMAGRRRARPQLEGLQEGEEDNEEDEDGTAPRATEPQPMAELSAENVDVKKYWNTAMRSRQKGAGVLNTQFGRPTPAETDFSEDEARVWLMLEEHPLTLTSPKTIMADTGGPERNKTGKRLCKAPRVVAEPADPLLHAISSVLASVSQTSDAESRHAMKLDLEIMAIEFKERFRDGLVNQDLQRAINSLEDDAVTVPRNETDDSGYESMGSDKEEGQEDKQDEGEVSPIAGMDAIPNIRSSIADDTGALRNRTEEPRIQDTPAPEPCNPPVQPSGDEQPNQPQKTQEEQMLLRKKFSFEKGADEVVEASHAVAALRALVESGEADAIQSAIVPSIHTRLGLDQKPGGKSPLNGAAVRSAATGSPRAMPPKQTRPRSAAGEEGHPCPGWRTGPAKEEAAVLSSRDLARHPICPAVTV